MSGHKTLSAAESERLAMLIEECGEVITAATKVLRHGYECHHPERPSDTNRRDLEREMADVEAVLSMLYMAGDVTAPIDLDVSRARLRKRQYAHHQ